jgi:hypothetical protein
MKKVRYAARTLGAFGMLPAVGLLVPAATTHAPATTGKSVRMLPRIQLAPCDARHTHTSTSSMRGYISYSQFNGCIAFLEGHFYRADVSGLVMQVRMYNNGTQVVPERYVPEIQHPQTGSNGSLSFRSNPLVHGVQQICEEIVGGSPSHYWEAGPVCQRTGYSGS